jgi:hypothetical protein
MCCCAAARAGAARNGRGGEQRAASASLEGGARAGNARARIGRFAGGMRSARFRHPRSCVQRPGLVLPTLLQRLRARIRHLDGAFGLPGVRRFPARSVLQAAAPHRAVLRFQPAQRPTPRHSSGRVVAGRSSTLLDGGAVRVRRLSRSTVSLRAIAAAAATGAPETGTADAADRLVKPARFLPRRRCRCAGARIGIRAGTLIEQRRRAGSCASAWRARSRASSRSQRRNRPVPIMPDDRPPRLKRHPHAGKVTGRGALRRQTCPRWPRARGPKCRDRASTALSPST